MSKTPSRSGPRRPKKSAPPGRSAGFDIVYEDEDLLVVDKEPGLLSATPPGSSEDSLFSMLKRRHRERRRHPDDKVYIIHRLDREASGLLVFAKSSRAFGWLKEDFRARRVKRSYAAVTEGEIDTRESSSGSLQSFLREDRYGRVKSVPRPEGMLHGDEHGDEDEKSSGPKLAVTHYEVIGAGKGKSLVRLRMETGRKHQIRVQMADMGHPLLGDERYGSKDVSLGRLALHAIELNLRHPQSGRLLHFRSRPPAAFFKSVGIEPRELVEGPVTGKDERTASPPRSTGRIDTSWDAVAPWYDDLVDDKKHDHHEDVILPGTLRLLGDVSGRRVLDVACGQGAVCRQLAESGATVTGIDSSARLIELARQHPVPPVHYEIGDARDLGRSGLGPFDAVTCIMALMNIDPLEPVLEGCAKMLEPGGRFVAVILHPAFRAPRQTSWGIEQSREGIRHFRRVDGYLSAGQYDITMNPGAAAEGKKKVVTWTFHRPLQTYMKMLAAAGFVVEALEEWPSLRRSQRGARSTEENRIRREIPLFLGIRCKLDRPRA